MKINRLRHLKAQVSSSESGFTLVELLVTMVVVVLALGGYIAANNKVSQRTGEMFEKSIALQAANSVIEQMRFSAETGQFPDDVVQAFPNNSQVGGFDDLTNQQVVVSYVDTGTDPLDVTVRVFWLSRGQRQVSVDLRTLITRRTG